MGRAASRDATRDPLHLYTTLITTLPTAKDPILTHGGQHRSGALGRLAPADAAHPPARAFAGPPTQTSAMTCRIYWTDRLICGPEHGCRPLPQALLMRFALRI